MAELKLSNYSIKICFSLTKFSSTKFLSLCFVATLLLYIAPFFPSFATPELASGVALQQSAGMQSLNSAKEANANKDPITPKDGNAVDAQNTAKEPNTHIVATALETTFKADVSSIWNTLTDFLKYPLIFKRIKSVKITKQEGSLVFVESFLKPGLFVQRPVQHMVNDLGAGPSILKWHMLDGNFKYLKGKWEIQPHTPHTCKVKYTLYVDLGPLVPPPLISFVIHHIQQEIVTDLKRYIEAEYSKNNGNKNVSSAVISH